MELEPLKEIPFDILSPIGLIGGAMFANVFPVIPEEIFLVSFGYLTNTEPMLFPFIKTAVFLIIGLLIMDIIVYFLAKKGNKIISFIINRVLNIDLKSKEEFIKKHIKKIIFISRFLVQIRSVGPASAALINYPIKKFTMINLLALIIYVPIYMVIGYYFRESVEKILSGTNALGNIFSSALILIVVILLMLRLKNILLLEINGDTIKKIKSTFNKD